MRRLYLLSALLFINLMVFSQAISYSPDSIIVGQDTGCGITSYVPMQTCSPPVDPWQGGSQTCSIDLNGDGTIDLTTYYYTTSVAMQGYKYSTRSLSATDSCYICVQPTNTGLADSIKLSDIVDSSRTWGKSVDLGTYSWSMNGNSSSTGYYPAYFGIKIKNGNVITYGWYRGSVFAATSICVIPDTTHHDQDTTQHHLQSNGSSNTLKIYPNPANDVLIIQADTSAQITVSIEDITGRELINTIILDQKGIDIKYLPYGVYFVELRTFYKSVRQKLVIYH